MADGMRQRLILPKGGLIKTGGGLVTPGGGILAPVYGAEQSINVILTAADPMQALIDAMGFATKPDYMWGGNEASGATEIGGSGYDLVANSVDQQQTSAELGPGNHCVFNAFADSMSNTTDTALQVGSGSFAALWVGSYQSHSGTAYTFGDRDGTSGWAIATSSSGTIWRFYLIAPIAGVQSAAKAASVATNTLHVVIGVKNATDNDADIFTPDGDTNLASAADESLTPASPDFAINDTGAGNGAIQTWGIAALWKGSAAESITTTHRSNLATYLGAL